MTSPSSGPPPPRRSLPGPVTRDPQTTAQYILDLSGELSRLAAEARLDVIAYLLDMVRAEADQMIKRTASPPKAPGA